MNCKEWLQNSWFVAIFLESRSYFEGIWCVEKRIQCIEKIVEKRWKKFKETLFLNQPEFQWNQIKLFDAWEFFIILANSSIAGIDPTTSD